MKWYVIFALILQFCIFHNNADDDQPFLWYSKYDFRFMRRYKTIMA